MMDLDAEFVQAISGTLSRLWLCEQELAIVAVIAAWREITPMHLDRQLKIATLGLIATLQIYA